MNDPRTHLDDAIDLAVRDLVHHDPPAGFRGRVLSRLESSSRRTWLWPGLATAAAALAVVTMTVVMRDEPSGPTPAPQQVAASESAPTPLAVPSTAPAGRAPQPVAPPRVRRAPERQPVRMATFGPRNERVSATSVRETPLSVAIGAEEPMPDSFTLPAPPPIVVGPIAPPPPLAIQPIVVVPIQIPRMQPVPVSPPR